MVQKDILTKQYEFTPILNDDGSVKTSIEKKVAKKSGKSGKGGAQYVAANTGTTVQDVLGNGSIDKVPVYFNGTKQSGVVEINDDGTYNVSTSVGGTLIAKNKTYAEMKDALESASTKAAKKVKK
jgi:hypothetical protein